MQPWPLSPRFPHAAVHADAEVDEDVSIGHFCVVGPRTKIGRGTVLHNGVTVAGTTDIGCDNKIFPGSVIGTDPQDLKYDGEETRVSIGHRNTIRECVTVHKGTAGGGGLTRIGDDNLIMACCHIAHDCLLGSQIIMGNSVLLGGHVKVENQAHFGGLAAIHHFSTIGRLAFIGGMSRITKDVPPFMLVEGNPSRVWGVNRVGCERRGLDRAAVDALHQAFKKLFREGTPQREAVAGLRADGGLAEVVVELLDFLESAESGPKGRIRERTRPAD